MPTPIRFDNSYNRLPARFFAALAPTPVAAPKGVRVNVALARDLGIDPDWLAGDDGVAAIAGNALPPGAEPLAMAYSGHQFGHWSGQLGDGRAILLGETVAPDGRRYDIHLKGSGRTPFSRGGDGRAALGPVLREFLIGEGMHALGIPTTRVLAAVTTGESVLRQEGRLPGAVLARVALGHIRVGTFEHFAARDDDEAVRILADYCLARFYPALAEGTERYARFLETVIARTAALIAKWQCVGFIHGVMNTDNMSISGETIDYGPCAFMDVYHPGTVFSSIDHGGRYAYANQPRIAQWNLARFATALLPLLGAEEPAAIAAAQTAIDAFPAQFDAAYLAGMRAKLGLAGAEDGDRALVADLLERMAERHLDFTNTFRDLADGVDCEALGDWRDAWAARRARGATSAEAMAAANPVYIPRNHRVEAALAASYEGNLAPFDELLEVLRAPFERRPAFAAYAAPPAAHEVVEATFCGT
ncbi:MAG: YdiU family protein [Magnetospirillum sp.]|nr:YdiU family protein [Magnetospirillum sp.]